MSVSSSPKTLSQLGDGNLSGGGSGITKCDPEGEGKTPSLRKAVKASTLPVSKLGGGIGNGLYGLVDDVI